LDLKAGPRLPRTRTSRRGGWPDPLLDWRRHLERPLHGHGPAVLPADRVPVGEEPQRAWDVRGEAFSALRGRDGVRVSRRAGPRRSDGPSTPGL